MEALGVKQPYELKVMWMIAGNATLAALATVNSNSSCLTSDKMYVIVSSSYCATKRQLSSCLESWRLNINVPLAGRT